MSKHNKLDVVEDMWGDQWMVRVVRDTTHGWDLLLGVPAGRPRRMGAKVIVTTELAAYLDQFRRNPIDVVLPLGRTAIKRVRKLLGHDAFGERRSWWEERVDDLGDLTLEAFAVKHGERMANVETWRMMLLGRKTRSQHWYLDEPARELLASDLPRAYVAEELDIPVGTVGRLRWVVRRAPKAEE